MNVPPAGPINWYKNHTQLATQARQLTLRMSNSHHDYSIAHRLNTHSSTVSYKNILTNLYQLLSSRDGYLTADLFHQLTLILPAVARRTQGTGVVHFRCRYTCVCILICWCNKMMCYLWAASKQCVTLCNVECLCVCSCVCVRVCVCVSFNEDSLKSSIYYVQL